MKIEYDLNLWDLHSQGKIICITTNGVTKKNGEAVMGKGIALDAATRFPDLPALLGKKIKKEGNRVHWFPEQRLVTFPTKDHWKNKSELRLINNSAIQLQYWYNIYGEDATEGSNVYLPTPGCGCGGLKWEEVEQGLSVLLDDHFTVVLQGK